MLSRNSPSGRRKQLGLSIVELMVGVAIGLVITAAELEKLGSNKLKPGMAAEAFIQTTAQTPLSYMLKPLTDQVSRALRES